jgi:hypothetical protein
MSRLRLLITAISLLTLVGCASFNHAKHPPISKLQGIWEGETVEQDGSIKRWRQIRTLDGKYVTFFGIKNKEGEIKEFIDNGKWWDEEAHFHELGLGLEEEVKPYIYSYEFYKTDCVRFVQTSKAGEEPGAIPYTFTECKVEEAPKVSHKTKQT